MTDLAALIVAIALGTWAQSLHVGVAVFAAYVACVIAFATGWWPGMTLVTTLCWQVIATAALMWLWTRWERAVIGSRRARDRR